LSASSRRTTSSSKNASADGFNFATPRCLAASKAARCADSWPKCSQGDRLDKAPVTPGSLRLSAYAASRFGDRKSFVFGFDFV
jgi:hypothetical protein